MTHLVLGHVMIAVAQTLEGFLQGGLSTTRPSRWGERFEASERGRGSRRATARGSRRL